MISLRTDTIHIPLRKVTVTTMLEQVLFLHYSAFARGQTGWLKQGQLVLPVKNASASTARRPIRRRPLLSREN